MTAAFIQDEIEEKPMPMVKGASAVTLPFVPIPPPVQNVKFSRPRKPKRSWLERIIRGLSASRIAKLRGKCQRMKEAIAAKDAFIRKAEILSEQERKRDEAAHDRQIGAMHEEINKANSLRGIADSEAARLGSVIVRHESRIKELEVELAVSRRECELLAAVVERDHKRIQAETRVHCQLIEENDSRRAPGVVVAEEMMQ